jgi:RHS repeat-associated protein
MENTMRPSRSAGLNFLWMVASLTIWLASSAAHAQLPYTDPPDTIGQRGVSSTGQITPSQIESVNEINGNVTVTIPLGHLPSGPAGFSGGVNLIYNSSVADVKPLYSTGPYTYEYIPSAKGGGWNYGFKYTLWAQPRFPWDQIWISGACGVFSSAARKAWLKNFLMTPDGASHALSLVGVLDSSGNQQPPPASWTSDPNNDAYVQYDFAGLPNPFCSTGVSPYSGTLIFATSDSSFIRVEANTSTLTWVAYFPDGSQAGGPIQRVSTPNAPTGSLNATDSDSNQIQDRNGNTLTITSSCSVGKPCIDTITEGTVSAVLRRPIQINYAATGTGSWTDTVESLGVHSSLDTNNNIVNPLTTTVNWETYTLPQSVPYHCQVDGQGNDAYGSGNSYFQCDLTNPLGGEPVFSPSVVTSVQLPPPQTNGSGTTFNFAYNTSVSGNRTWGELHSITKCVTTGATCTTNQWSVSYDYQFDWLAGQQAPCTTPGVIAERPPAIPINPICRRVLEYQEVRDNGSSAPISQPIPPETTLYHVLGPLDAFTYPTIGNSDVITNPDGSQASITTFSLCPTGFSSRDYCPAVPTLITNFDGSTTKLGWASNSAPSGVPSSAIFNPYTQFRVQSPSVGGVQKGTQTKQDQNGNVTEIDGYDWGVTTTGSPNITGLSGSPLRTTSISYYNTTAYDQHSAPPFLRAPYKVTVCAATGCTGGSTTYNFDSPTTTANLTTLQQTDSVQGMISTNWTYLANGNLSTTIDPNGVETIICYDSNGLYPVSSVVAAQTNASCPAPPALPAKLTEGRGTTYSIDGTTGRVDSVTDSDNHVTTSYAVYDDTGRVTTATQSGGSLSRTTTTTYDDVNLSVTTTQDDTSSQKLVTTTAYDPVGRVRLTVDGAGNKVQRAYRYGTGGVSYELASNPYAAASDPTMGWKLITKDAVGRPTSVQYFKGDGTLTNAPAPWNASGGGSLTPTGTESMVYNDVTSNCGVPANEVTDAAGILHTYWLDGLGRLAAATEADGTITNYAYDALDNLSAVSAQSSASATCPTAGNVLRSFVYSNPLSRLQSASNPEGTNAAGISASYVYDPNGNVLQRTDANGTVTAAVASPATGKPYDGLNRPYGYSYAPAAGNPHNVAATPPVTYGYDQGGFVGAMSSVSTTVGTSTYSTSYTYDTLGRITASTQNVPGYAQFKFQYGYSLTDQLTSMTYPTLGAGTGRQVNYLLDAADRVQTVQNGTGGGNYASIGYTPANGEQSVTMGNGVTQQMVWNDRLQAVGLSAATAEGSLLTMGWYPCPQNQTSCATSTNAGVTTGNNGNLLFQTVSFPAIGNVPGLSLTQSYTYDQLGRLKTAGEGTGSWSQTYGYTNGNRYVSANSGFSLSPSTPTVASNFDSKNRLQVNGAAYDNGQPSGNGNQTAIGGYTYTYDAENRMVSAVLSAGATLVSSAGYVYDGAGQRVQKMTCWSSVPCTPSSSDATITTYVYDAFGNLAQEYGPYLNAWCATPTCYLTQDQIGSTRMVTDANGLVGTRYDFLPFGEEVPAGTGGRTQSMGYNAWEDNSNPKFAGQMRDPESARDLMGFRYYSPQEGRFVSVDPGNAGADGRDPQTWNGYSYVGNNPVNITDPDGLGFWSILGDIFDQFFTLGFGVGIGDSAPWNEQIPITPSNAGDPLNLGGVFGGGDMAGGVIFSAEPVGDGVSTLDSVLANFPLIPQGIVDFISGWGDNLSFTLTAQFRRLTGTQQLVDPCSGYYTAGEWTGIVHSLVTGGTQGVASSGAKGAGKEFSHFIPKSIGKQIGGPIGDFIQSNNRLNGNYVSLARHYLHDPTRFPSKAIQAAAGPKYPAAIGILDRTPNWIRGATAGAAYAGGSRAINGGCRAQ